MSLQSFSVKDQAEGQLFASILASDLSLTLLTGEGAEFPTTIIGTATSGGTINTLNSTGIQAKGVALGDLIENVTDGSLAVITAIATNSVTTTDLRGGSDNTWQNSDAWAIGRMVGTLQARTVASGVVTITKSEKILIGNRVGDVFTITQRGYDGSSATGFDSNDYLVINVVSLMHSSLKAVIADVLKFISELQASIALKADTATMTALLNARNWKNSCKYATTAAVTLASSLENGDPLDGQTLATGDRILVKNQASAIENGIYTVNVSGAPTRATDFDVGSEISSAVVAVEKGTTNADTVWFCTSDNPTVGASNIDFTSFGTKNISDVNATDLTDGGNTTLHGHVRLDSWIIPALGNLAYPSACASEDGAYVFVAYQTSSTQFTIQRYSRDTETDTYIYEGVSVTFNVSSGEIAKICCAGSYVYASHKSSGPVNSIKRFALALTGETDMTIVNNPASANNGNWICGNGNTLYLVLNANAGSTTIYPITISGTTATYGSPFTAAFNTYDASMLNGYYFDGTYLYHTSNRKINTSGTIVATGTKYFAADLLNFFLKRSGVLMALSLTKYAQDTTTNSKMLVGTACTKW